MNSWCLHTINLQAVLLGDGASCTGGCAGVRSSICLLSAGDLQLTTSWQNPDPLVRFHFRTWNINKTQDRWGVPARHPCMRTASPRLIKAETGLPSFVHVRLGGGMPLDSHIRVMRLPSTTVRGDASSEPRILGDTVIAKGRQKEAVTLHALVLVNERCINRDDGLQRKIKIY